MGPGAMALVFWMLSFNPDFLLSFFIFINRLFSSSLSAIRVIVFAYLSLLLFLPAILIPAHFFQPGIPRDVFCIKVKEVGWHYSALMYSSPNFESAHCSISSCNCYFLTSVQLSQEASKVVWCSHLFKNFPQFVVIHTLKACKSSLWSRSRWYFLEFFCFL